MCIRPTRRRGQVTVEVAVLFAFVVAGLVAMAVYLQRGVQGSMKSNADGLGQQFSSADPWEAHSRSSTLEKKESLQSTQLSDACQGIGGMGNPGCDPGTGDSAFDDPNNVELP